MPPKRFCKPLQSESLQCQPFIRYTVCYTVSFVAGTRREDAIIGEMQQSEEVAMFKRITHTLYTIGVVAQALADLAGYVLAALVGVGVFALLGVAAWSLFS